MKRSRPAGALFHAEEAAALRCSVDFHITAKSSRILSRHHVHSDKEIPKRLHADALFNAEEAVVLRDEVVFM